MDSYNVNCKLQTGLSVRYGTLTLYPVLLLYIDNRPNLPFSLPPPLLSCAPMYMWELCLECIFVPIVAGQVNFLQVAYSQTGCLDSD